MNHAAALAMVIAAAVTTACSRSEHADGACDARTRIVVGYSALRISLPLFVARERGYFRRHGLEVTLRRYDTAQPLVEEVLDGRIPAGGYSALPIVFAAAASDGSEIRIATALIEDAEHPVSRLLRRKGSSQPTGVADLAGRRVGILPTVAYRRWLEAMLRGAGVDPGLVTVVPLAPAQQALALANGGVDALFTNDPMATAAVHGGAADPLGPPAPVTVVTGGRLLFGSFLVHAGFAREKPDVVDRLLATLDEAIAGVAADQAGAREAMLPYVREPERAYVSRYPPARYLPSTELTEALLAEEIDTEMRLGIVERRPRAAGWIVSRRVERGR